MGFASCVFISSPQHSNLPPPALVQRASVPHLAHLYLFPNWLAIFVPPAVLLFDLHGLAAADDGTGAGFRDDTLGAAFCAAVSLAYNVCHINHLSVRNYSTLL